jgi:phage terminase large subunit-like protein
VIPYVQWVEGEKGFLLQSTYMPETDTFVSGGRLKLFPLQKRILGHCLTPDANDHFPYTTILYSAPKKSGKTTIGASVGSWFLQCGPAGSEIYSIANDQEQSLRIFDDIGWDASMNHGIVPTKYLLRWPDTGSYIKAIAQEHKSAAGGRQAMTLWDELWGYTSPRSMSMWAEMQPVPTVPISLRVVVTYAGTVGESTLLEDLYQKVVIEGEPVPELADIVDSAGRPVCWRKGRIFAYWDTEPRMPWQTDEYYETALDENRPADYLRLHRNQWVTGLEEFIPIEMWDACVTLEKPLEFDPEDPRHFLPLTVAVDAGTKHDCTAVVATYFNRVMGKVGTAWHRIWTPVEGEDFDLENTVERTIIEAKQKGFRISQIIYDPHQMHRSMMTLKKLGFNVVEMPQTAGNMIAASQNIYNLLKSKSLETYPDAEFRDHVRFSVAENKGNGFRITKVETSQHSKGRRPNDAMIALAMAAYHSVLNQGADVSAPIRMEVPFADASAWKPKSASDEEKSLPWMFQNG